MGYLTDSLPHSSALKQNYDFFLHVILSSMQATYLKNVGILDFLPPQTYPDITRIDLLEDLITSEVDRTSLKVSPHSSKRYSGINFLAL